jgi:hypothetical protein
MDKYLFSYAAASDPPIQRALIRLVRYDADALAAVPKTGPVVFVANHPYGVLDGIVMAWLVSKARPDFLILTHIVLTRAPEAASFILPVDFSGAGGAEETNLASHAAARAHLAKGGAVVVFPAGAISTTPDKLGLKPAVDGRWQPFVSQLIQRSKATVVPIWFGGQNSRLFQIASHVSLTLRLSLIFHEACRSRSARPSHSHPSLQSEIGRRSRTSYAPASMLCRGWRRRSLISRAAPSGSSCAQSFPCRERTGRRKAGQLSLRPPCLYRRGGRGVP